MSLAVNRIAFAGAWIRRHLRPSPGILAGLLAVYGLGGIMLGLLVWGSRGFAPLPMSFASGLLSMGGGTIAASINIIAESTAVSVR